MASSAHDAVTQKSTFEAKPGQVVITGEDFAGLVSLDGVMAKMLTTGFQATNVALAVQEINRMIAAKMGKAEAVSASSASSPDTSAAEEDTRTPCTIFLSYTSNMISSGIRETIKFLVQHKLVDVLVSTAGGIEEDFIKCLAPTYLGDFKLKGKELRAEGLNRLGNLLIPNNNYCAFEDWLNPILHAMADEQVAAGTRWTPSLVIDRLGKEIDNPESVYYWAHKNSIPVFCPAITDGSLGDMMYFFNYRRPEFIVDVVADIRKINDIAVRARSTGMIILGGGMIKHHTCNANLMRNGAEYSVFINTGQEFDGSDSGASPDEAVSWGKIKMTARPVKVCADASLVFPLIVSQTFYKQHQSMVTASSSSSSSSSSFDSVTDSASGESEMSENP